VDRTKQRDVRLEISGDRLDLTLDLVGVDRLTWVVVEHDATRRRHKVSAGERRVVVPRTAPVVLRTASSATVQLQRTVTITMATKSSRVETSFSLYTVAKSETL